MTGRYDASYGCYLKGNKNKTFTAVPPAQSGFVVNGDVKDMALIHADKQKLILVAVNNDSMRVFGVKSKSK
jgi:enediyne biosynthesis protein E4